MNSKSKYLNLIFIAVIAYSCKEKSTDTSVGTKETNEAPNEEIVVSPLTGCYIYTQGKDTTWLNLKIENDNATAMFDYIPHNQHTGIGHFIGKIVENKIEAKYTYKIEGSSQTEEVIFKIENDHLVREIGPLEEKAGVLVPKDKNKPTQLHKYLKGPCRS